MRNRRCLTDPRFGLWFPLERSSRGGPAGEGMRVTVAGTWGAAAAPGRRHSGKALAAVQEMGFRGMLYIPQRHYICTDRCSRANLRRRGGHLPAEQQVRQKKKTLIHTSTHSYSASLLYILIQSSSLMSRANYCLLFCLSASHPRQSFEVVHTLSTNYSHCWKCSQSKDKWYSCK